MTSEQDQARLIAERIARRVDNSPAPTANRPANNIGNLGSELAAVRTGLDDLRQRLVQIESRLSSGNAMGAPGSYDAMTSSIQTSSTRPQTFTSSTYVPVNAHPSFERFGVEEATVSELVDYFEGEKKCDLEPGGKPCDHCEMCSSRGF
jgi:hypothetical protein